MKSLKILLILLLLGGCVQGKPVIRPTEPAPTPLSIKIYPAIAMVEGDINITCQLPLDAGEGAFSFGIVDYFRSSGPIDSHQISRVVQTPCEPFTVFCGYQQVGGKPIFVSQEVTPVGECR